MRKFAVAVFNAVAWFCLWTCFAAALAFVAASIFVMRDQETQNFLLQYGVQITYSFAIACLFFDWLRRKLSEPNKQLVLL